MTLNWTPNDSPHSTSWDNAHASAPTQSSPLPPPLHTKPNRLLAIDDFDFEALIEILGTDGDDVKGPTKYNFNKNSNRPLDDMQVLRDRERKPRFDKPASSAAPLSARRARTVSLPSKQTAAAAPRLSAEIASTSQKPITTSTKGRVVTSNASPTMSTSRTANSRAQPSTKSQATSIRTDERRSYDKAATKGNGNASFAQLNKQLGSTISDTKTQVTDLQNRIQDLKDEVKDFAPHLYRKAFDGRAQRPTSKNVQPPASASTSAPAPERRTDTNTPNADPPPLESRATKKSELETIFALSEEEAKNALANIVLTLNISPSSLPTTSLPSPLPTTTTTTTTTNTTPITNLPLASLPPALHLIRELDHLVWKDTNLHTLRSEGQAPNNIYDAHNIQAILDRVRLWERTARSRIKR